MQLLGIVEVMARQGRVPDFRNFFYSFFFSYIFSAITLGEGICLLRILDVLIFVCVV